MLNALLLTLALGADPGAALNARGFRLYQAKKYPEALALFRQAKEASPRLALAHYNYAATLSLLRKLTGPCAHDAYRSAILDALEEAIRLDPRRKKRALEDQDFEAVHDTFRWQTKLLGRTVAKDAGAILEAVSWYLPSPGAYGPSGTLDFQPKGALSSTSLTFDDEGNLKRLAHPGTWSVTGAKVTVTTKGEAKPTASTGTLSDDGTLDFGGGGGRYTDDPDDCSA